MTDHDTGEIVIALTAIVLAWSIAFLLTIAFGQSFPSEPLALVDDPSSLTISGPCDRLDINLR